MDETVKNTNEQRVVGVPFTKDDPRINREGRKPETPEQKIAKKATKELIAEYKEALGESLPMIRPILIAKALEGDMVAIKEIHDRVMDKAKQSTDIMSDGKAIPFPILGYNVHEDTNTKEDSTPEEEN
jgi:hypothetical protein